MRPRAAAAVLPRRDASRRVRQQRGVATLIVVAVLFFVLALVAAYTNRSMVFEQRTSGNQYRSTQAFEAAEAGAEWALSMLNGGRIDDQCAPSVDPIQPSFRERFLAVDPGTGRIMPQGALSADGGGGGWPGCVFDGIDWSCRCPAAGRGMPPAPAGTGVFPAFRVRFVDLGGAARPGVIRMEVNGCTRLDDACLDFPGTGLAGEGRATVRVMLALRGGLAIPPRAALTVRGAVDGDDLLATVNADAASGGVAILAGGAITEIDLGRVLSVPGTPPADALVAGDPGLAGLPDGDRLFTNLFALPPAVYRDQPGAIRLDCSAAPCSAADIRGAADAHPHHVVWADGDVDLDGGAGGGTIGSIAQPVLLVVDGDLALRNLTLNGAVYLRKGAPVVIGTGAGQVLGAVVAEGGFGGTAGSNPAMTFAHDPAIVQRLRWGTGSFARVPGGWRDYQ
ncbi:MAG: fimbrial assembly protein [Burkholderiales bacterium]|nr:fimbrial assembly protein [Burkholderiales bacterium]